MLKHILKPYFPVIKNHMLIIKSSL
jgi:hypothetical protein